MENKEKLPPPTDELPDYFLGRLIYYDGASDNTMRWCVYDGDTTVRCLSRRRAEEYCAEKIAKHSKQFVTNLVLAAGKIRQAWLSIEDAAHLAGTEQRLTLERKALELRLIFDQIDTMITQTKTKL